MFALEQSHAALVEVSAVFDGPRTLFQRKLDCRRAVSVRRDRPQTSLCCLHNGMMIQNSVLIENKAVQALNKAHEIQLVNYLVATQIETGLLLNFGAQRLQFKRKTRVYRGKEDLTSCQFFLLFLYKPTVVRLYSALTADHVLATSLSAALKASRSVFSRAASRASSVFQELERRVSVAVPSATP